MTQISNFIAPSIEELHVRVPTPIQMYVCGKGRNCSKFTKGLNTHNSSLEGATELKCAPFCSS